MKDQKIGAAHKCKCFFERKIICNVCKFAIDQKFSAQFGQSAFNIKLLVGNCRIFGWAVYVQLCKGGFFDINRSFRNGNNIGIGFSFKLKF